MAIQISASVGINGVNREVDITRIQYLLKKAAKDTGQTAMNPGRIDGLLTRNPADSKTVKALQVFERSIGATPDGRVEPGDTVYQRLLAYDQSPINPADGELFLLFDGSRLSLRDAKTWWEAKTLNPFDDEIENRYSTQAPTLASWRAVSGLMSHHPKIKELIDGGRTDLKLGTDYTKSVHQNVRDVGPIPAGFYYIESKPGMAFDKSGGAWGQGRWWIRYDTWGERRLAQVGAIRSGFFLHEDGMDPAKMNGTSGCIGLVPGNIQDVRMRLVEYFRTSGESTIVLRVVY